MSLVAHAFGLLPPLHGPPVVLGAIGKVQIAEADCKEEKRRRSRNRKGVTEMLRVIALSGSVAYPPTCGPLLILFPALKRWASPRWQGLCSQSAHLWATFDSAPGSEAPWKFTKGLKSGQQHRIRQVSFIYNPVTYYSISSRPSPAPRSPFLHAFAQHTHYQSPALHNTPTLQLICIPLHGLHRRISQTTSSHSCHREY